MIWRFLGSHVLCPGSGDVRFYGVLDDRTVAGPFLHRIHLLKHLARSSAMFQDRGKLVQVVKVTRK